MNYLNPKMVMPKWLTLSISFVFLFFMACDNNSDQVEINFDEQAQSAYEADGSAENLFDVIESITYSALQASEVNSGGRIMLKDNPELSCATIKFEGSKQSGRIEIDFGEGCEGPDGKERKGIIVIEYDGHWLAQGSEIFTVLKDFYIDGLKVEGTRILTNVSIGLLTIDYTVEIIDGKVTWPDGTYLTRQSEGTHTWIIGTTLQDFEIHVSGEAFGKTRLGVEYISEITEPLVFKSDCIKNMIYLPANGRKIISIPEKPVMTVDFGTGDCDAKFMVTIGERSKEVLL